MAGHTVYHGVAKNVYVAKEVVIGMTLGLIAGAAWKVNSIFLSFIMETFLFFQLFYFLFSI